MRQIGRYQIESEVGRGGMGVVYRAFDPVLGRTVAVKSIRLSEFAEPEHRAELQQRLVREARAAGMLAHPNIVTVYDLVQDEDRACIVMEFVGGVTLAGILAAGRPLDNATILSLLCQVGAALDYAHAKGIVHRDVKPANLIVQAGGAVKIADFGIARVSTSLQLTKSGVPLGTPYYMSPEQAQGRAVDGRADQFSLAVTTYEILTGRRPFSAETPTSLLYKIVHEEPVSVELLNTTLGPQVGSVLRKALSKDPEARFASCHEFVNAFERACSATKGWRAISITEQVAPAGPVLRRWWLAAGLGLLTAILVAAGYFMLSRPLSPREPTRVEPTAAEGARIPAPQAVPVSPQPPPAEVIAPPAETPPRMEKPSPPKPKFAQPRKEGPAAKPQRSRPPAEEPSPAPAPPLAYVGPPSGRLVWTGELEPGSQLVIDGKLCSTGSVGNELPGVPVKIELWPSSATVIQAPGSQNRWKRLVIGSGDRRQLRIIVRWEVIR